MKRSDYTDYDQLPLFLNAEMTARTQKINRVWRGNYVSDEP